MTDPARSSTRSSTPSKTPSTKAPSSKTSTQRAKRGPSEGPVDRAFHLLQTVVAAKEPLGVREIGRRTGLPRSTASRLVSNLERLRMVERNADGDVVPGGALATLQTSGPTTPLLRDRLQPLLTELVHQFGENAALAVDDSDALLYVSNVDNEHAVSVSDVTGERHVYHLVAPGLVAMAYWSDSRLAQYFKSPLPRATDYSVTGVNALRRRLKRCRIDGFVWTDQELDVGINGLAVPVVSNDELVAAISLYGPSYRFSPEKRPTLGQQLRSIVDERLGNEVHSL